MPFYSGYATKLDISTDQLDDTKMTARHGVVNLIARIGGALDPLCERFRVSIVKEGQYLIETLLAADGTSKRQRENLSMLELIFALLRLHKLRSNLLMEALGGHRNFLAD